MQWFDWVPWVIGVLGFLFGIFGELRARRAEKGDSIEFDSEARLTLKRPGAVIEWHFAGSKKTRSTRRIVTGLNPNDK